jgi:hypothetical protein
MKRFGDFSQQSPRAAFVSPEELCNLSCLNGAGWRDFVRVIWLLYGNL